MATRKATLYTDSVKFNTTTTPRIGLAVAAILLRPVAEIDEHFANSEVFVSSFYITQPDIFDAVLRATGTTEDDWQIERRKCQEGIDEGVAKVKSGDPMGNFKALFASRFMGGYGGSYQDKVLEYLPELEAHTEDLLTIIRAAAGTAVAGAWTGGEALRT